MLGTPPSASREEAIDEEVPGEFSKQQQQQEAQEMEEEQAFQSVKKRGFGQAAKEARRKKAFTVLTSYKADNNPRALEHMAKTWGLIGDSHRLQRRNTNEPNDLHQQDDQEKLEQKTQLKRASTIQ